MKIELSQSFAANGKVDEFDVKQMKKVLNRLGYYQPYEKIVDSQGKTIGYTKTTYDQHGNIIHIKDKIGGER